MRKMTHTAFMAIGCVTGSMMFAGGIVTGCGSSSSGGDDTAEDSGADSTAAKPDSGADARGDSSLATVDSGTVAEDTGTGDTGTVTGDTGTGTGDASDSGSEAGDGAAEAEAGCVTSTASIPGFSDAGTAVLVTGFDNGITSGWTAFTDVPLPDAGVTGSVAFSPTVGLGACPGSIVMAVPFTEYGAQTVDIKYDYNANLQTYPAWTNHTKLHYWVQIAFDGGDAGLVDTDAEAGASYFNTINENGNYAQWFNYTAESNNHMTVELAGTSFAAQPWQEVVLDLSDDTQPAADAGGFPVPTGTSCSATTGGACKFASQLEVVATMPEGGPDAPTTTLLYIDDIWLE